MILQVLSLLQWCLDPANLHYTSEAASVMKSYHCKYETVPLSALGFQIISTFHGDVHPHQSPLICTHTAQHIGSCSYFATGKSDQVQKENGPCLVQPSYHTPLSPEMPFPSSCPNRIPFSCPNASADFYYLLLDFFLLALRRYNKS